MIQADLLEQRIQTLEAKIALLAEQVNNLSQPKFESKPVPLRNAVMCRLCGEVIMTASAEDVIMCDCKAVMLEGENPKRISPASGLIASPRSYYELSYLSTSEWEDFNRGGETFRRIKLEGR